MPRQMDALESSLFVDRHPGLLDEIHMVDNANPPWTVITPNAADLAFPWGDGRAIFDQAFNGYVLVWRDATKHWHFIDLSDKKELAAVFNNAPYASPDLSFTENMIEEARKLAEKIAGAITTGLIVAVAVIVLAQQRR